MSKPIDPDRPGAPTSRAPKSGQKPIDPTKYQMDTVPAELVAKIAQMRMEPRPKEVFHPPPLFDERPIIGRLRRLGVWISRRKTWLAVGCLVGLCVVVTMAVIRGSAKGDEKREGLRAVDMSTEAMPMTSVRPELSPPANGLTVEPAATPKAPHVSAPTTATSERPPTMPKSVASISNPTARTTLQAAANAPKRTATAPAKTNGDTSSGNDVMESLLVRKKPKPASP